MSTNTGGPAFPVTIRNEAPTGEVPGLNGDSIKAGFMTTYGGLTLRDYFAAKALAAMLANPNKDGAHCGRGGLDAFPRWAYEWADAMLKARDA